MSAQKLVIVDDHKIMREGLKALFIRNRDFTIVADMDNGADLFAYLDNNPVDIVLMDIHLPTASGLELAEQVKLNYPTVKVIMHTMSEDEVNMRHARRIHADGYVLKSSGHKELEQALQAVSEGKTFYSL